MLKPIDIKTDDQPDEEHRTNINEVLLYNLPAPLDEFLVSGGYRAVFVRIQVLLVWFNLVKIISKPRNQRSVLGNLWAFWLVVEVERSSSSDPSFGVVSSRV